MYKIIQKEILNPTVTSMHIEAPAVATKAQPGQFIILRVEEEGERIPLTIADALFFKPSAQPHGNLHKKKPASSSAILQDPSATQPIPTV